MIDGTGGNSGGEKPGHPDTAKKGSASQKCAPQNPEPKRRTAGGGLKSPGSEPQSMFPVNNKTDIIVSLADYVALKARAPELATENLPPVNPASTSDVQAHQQLSVCDPFDETQATVISFDRDREFLSSIEIECMTDIRMQFSSIAIEKILTDVGKLLRKEFGAALVRRDKRMFSVVHDDFEQLVAGILRVQFYSHQLCLPEYNIFGEKTDLSGITLTWGVGHNSLQANGERLKKKRQKRRQKTASRSGKPLTHKL